MNAEFFDAIAQIEREKNIPRAYMHEKIIQALTTAYRRDNAGVSENIFVDLDEERKTIRMYLQKVVVEEVENPTFEMTVEAARSITPGADVGDTVNIEVQTLEFGRIAAQTAKQVIIQGIREAERGMIYEEYSSREHEVLTAQVVRPDPRSGGVMVEITSKGETTEASLPPGEQMRDELLNIGDRVKVYVIEVRRTNRGPQLLLSRTHPGLVKRLFELEVPEIQDGTVEIRSIAREAGQRTKMAVWSNNPDVDPIGACIGIRRARINAVTGELGGEKIDVVRFSEEQDEFIAQALAPASVLRVDLIDSKTCRVVVPDDQLSLAIGKEGQNARLAAKLTGIKIDIKPESRAAEQPQ
ncbi:MAG: transcription termination factor NusA [Oscillospiraceae bacterium]|jgi:N utilization substance protein A|nr:transcription termination factor NusA [Oscillospiraceae bacterium]